MGRLLYGTSSFSEKSWVGPFYPDGCPPAEFLTHYAAQFGTVEVDVTYYRIPSESMILGWDRKTPDGFILSAKFPRSIVHCGEGPRPDPDALLAPDRVGEDTVQFLDVMRLLGPKLGPLVLQFPYFNQTVFPDAEPFLERLDGYLAGLPTDLRFGVEIRNKAWIKPPLMDLLRRHRAALVLVDLAYMPHPAGLARRMDLVTTDFVYARLIGDRKAVDERTKTFDKIVLDQTPRLERWAELLHDLANRVITTYVYANNHYAGHGPATIRELRDLYEA